MSFELRLERRRVRWFFAGLLAVSAVIDLVGATVIHRVTRTQVLDSMFPAGVTLGGRTGAVLTGLMLLLLAVGIARGKRIALRLALVALSATIVFELVKDLDIEEATLFAWTMFGLWWFRDHFQTGSDPAGMRLGVALLVIGVGTAFVYVAAGGDLVVATLPILSYMLVVAAITLVLHPRLAPRAMPADREHLRASQRRWGRNYISRLAAHGASSHYWLPDGGCVAYTLRGRTALALGDPIARPESLRAAVSAFAVYCERQDWIPAFYQVDADEPYRALEMMLVPIGAEAVVRICDFSLSGKKRADLRYALHRCKREGIELVFTSGPDALAWERSQLHEVSGAWLRGRNSPELAYSLGTLSTLADPDIVVGLALARDGRLEGFVSWLPVPARHAWTLDLVRRRPDATYGVIEALLVRSIEEARGRGIVELSLGMTPRVIPSLDVPRGVGGALRAMFWGLDRFQRSRTLHRYKEKFGPRWEERYLVVPSLSSLPEVLLALVRVHLPPLSTATAWVRALVSRERVKSGLRAAA
ncbi:MAG TPA: phosphatidylglycerol lysyltransferase domain-containing protein [Candidatus Dormibacteraeota bacterium]|nr:phosphatidylglycerol lysyltransferase domain-containing protein [Candidatus Dormibacteraeota bacterium]